MSRDLKDLNPYVAYLAEKLIKKSADNGINIFITQTLRTIEEQNELYAQGRTTKGSIVTNAKGGYSIHNFGYAFDVAIRNADGSVNWNDDDYYPIGQLGVEIGLEWGGNFTSIKDTPHFQYTQGLSTAQFRAGERPDTPNVEELIKGDEDEMIEVPSNFNEKYYLFANQDLFKAYQEGTLTDLKQHYITNGYKEGRSVCPTIPVGFNASKYLENYEDVRNSGMSAEEHYLSYGVYEGAGWR